MVFETLISFDDETKTRGKAVIIGEEDVVFAKVSFYYVDILQRLKCVGFYHQLKLLLKRSLTSDPV